MSIYDYDAKAFTIAQKSVLGRIILHPEEAGWIFGRVRIEDFDPPLVWIAEAIQSLRVGADRKPINDLAVVAELERRSTLSRVGGQASVNDCVNFGFAPVDVAVDLIARTTQLRKLDVTGTWLSQAARRDDADPLELAREAASRTGQVADFIETTSEDVVIQTVGDLLEQDDDPYDWVIPGLVERGDRLILTGVEGVGKSMLFRQFAVSAAAGLHPFTGARIPQQHVLLVDCENGRKHVKRQIRGLVIAGRQQGLDPSNNLLVEPIPSGLDLTRPDDEAWLLRRVSTLQPSMLCIGPLYRLHAGNPNDEEQARKVAAVLDRCRAAANCAVLTEAHSGHSNGFTKERPVRPVGSSLWLRWPEFGYGLRPSDDHEPPAYRSVDVVSWRGDREERDWPSRLVSGPTMPWRADTRPVLAEFPEAEPDTRYGS